MLKINGTKVYCWDPKCAKYMTMGQLIGSTFFKVVEAIHYMRVVDGYGFQYTTFSELPRHGVTTIHITERHTGNSWESSYKEWQEHGKIADYGRGKQIFLSLKYMHKVDKEKQEKERIQTERKRDEIKIQRGL